VQHIEIQVENDHIQRITSARPLAAVSELIWNAYDADAKHVKAELAPGTLTKLDSIRVIDDGLGIPFSEVDTLFQRLGGSWKKAKRRTADGRPIHGEKGQGRFKAFALGERVTWTSKNNGVEFRVTGMRENLKRFTISDPVAAAGQGCIVKISGVLKDFEIRADDGFIDQVRDVFALQLHEDPSFQITYDGQVIDARDAIDTVTPYSIESEVDGEKTEAILEVVELKKRVERKLMLCLPGRFSFDEVSPGIHARGFDFTAYLTSEYFQTLADQNTESLAELDKRAAALLETAKAKLREHFRGREAVRSRSRIVEWKKAKIYPYAGEATTSLEENERQLFDVVALNLADYSIDFEKSSASQQKLILTLIKTAIETDPSSLIAILEDVVALPKGRQDELADLLQKTSLVGIINAATSVTGRLDFLRALQLLIFDPKSKKQLLERSQLHRIIADETWIFGEQFNLTNDDEDLTAVLRSHLTLLGESPAQIGDVEPVVDADGNAAIVDLMLSSRVPTPTDDERRHLVVELKRPKQPINEDVINQIKKYAKAVALDHRFVNTNVEWDFIAVSNSFTDAAELEARQSGKPRGLVLDLEQPVRIRVWAKTWAEIIQEAEGRLTFYKRSLEYKANDEEALKYLQSINQAYLSEEVKARIAALEVQASTDSPEQTSSGDPA
jgi:hypothetical protein